MENRILIIISFILFAFLLESKGQYEFFQEKTNVVIFSGIVTHQQSDQLAGYYGLYVDYLAYKSLDHRFSMGPYGVISRSDQVYQLRNGLNRNLEYGGGLSLGYYEPNFSFRHQMFLGSSIGITAQKEKQEVIHNDGYFEAWQHDKMLSLSLNFNLLKLYGIRPDVFHRTQFQVRYKKPFSASKIAYWNSSPIETYVWDKTYLEAMLKQNVYKGQLSYKNDIYYSPKLVTYYSYSKGDSRPFYGLGTELSLFREYQDDFLSLGALYKVSRRFNDNYFIISLNLNIGRMLVY